MQKLITILLGSRCYALYTFSKEDWEKKAANFFWPKKFNNKYIEHGIKYENEALHKYKVVNKYDIVEMGIIICKQYPWLAYSPDGVVMEHGCPTRLVEIKCPYDGKFLGNLFEVSKILRLSILYRYIIA